jgi:hypothetical protein
MTNYWLVAIGITALIAIVAGENSLLQYPVILQNDGSNESAGRGMGLEQQNVTRKQVPAIPYMQMTFAPLERRLDMVIFRALFASSARQARQFVVHGAVTVNGKKVDNP